MEERCQIREWPAVMGSGAIACMQDVARGAIASPVEHIADSLDEHSEAENGAQMSSAIKGEFGDYSFHDAQLKARDLVWISPSPWTRHRSDRDHWKGPLSPASHLASTLIGACSSNAWKLVPGLLSQEATRSALMGRMGMFLFDVPSNRSHL